MSPDNTKQLLQPYRQAINRELQKTFDAAAEQLGVELSAYAHTALSRLSAYTLRPGKRVRGALGAFAYDSVAKTHLGAAGIQAGAALELAQSYLLIVDDVMDLSEMRRGKPAMHQLYRQEQKRTHLADMMAINVGLVAQHLMNLVVTAIDEDPMRVLHALRLLHRNVCITGFGQLDDLHQHAGGAVTERAVIRMYACKSSYYTFVNPLQMGLVLGGVRDERVLREAEEFGVAAGIAFQLHDDVLGVFGTASKTGKSNLDDLKEGKYTLLLHHALHHGDEPAQRLLRQVVGNPDITGKDLRRAQAALQKTGSKTFVEERALWYARQAKAMLAASTFWSSQAKTVLAALVDYSVARNT